ncbi:MAG: DUF5652 family protein [Nanoarchaeota archaeon]
MDPFLEQLASQMGIPIGLLIIALIWSLVWKAIAFWKTARNNHIIWFVIFFIVHTFGILEILYLFLFSKISLDKNKTLSKKSRKRQ